MSALSLLPIILLFAPIRGSTPDAAPPAPRIGEIEIDRKEIFDPSRHDERHWIFRLANKLHIATREPVIRQELLFAPGEPLDPELLAQTERNLRAFSFLRNARITSEPGDDGTAKVKVETWDAWSTELQLGFATAGNVGTWVVGVAERNLLGRGKLLEVARRSEIDRDSGTVIYRDPRIAGSRLAAEAVLSDLSDGGLGAFSLGRPFFSTLNRWAFRLGVSAFDRLDPLYANGEKVTELRHVRRGGELEFARALSRSSTSALRLHLAYRRWEDEVASDLRSFGVLEAGLTLRKHNFLKLTHVNAFENPEDFNLGHEASVFVGWSAEALGGEPGRSLFFFLEERRGFRLGREHFVLGKLSWGARHRRGKLENGMATAQADYYHKLSPRRLLAGSAQFRYGSRLDPEVQLTLGADTGLRGYPVRQFTGNRSLLLAGEHRWFIADEVARLLSIGLAGFVDAGFVWPEGESLALGDMRTDLGISLLIGRNRFSSRRGLRLDLAYALQPVPGRSRWLFSAGSRIGF
jgi:hypothetical protein